MNLKEINGELSECAESVRLGCDDWLVRRRYLELVDARREFCTCDDSINCPVHEVRR